MALPNISCNTFVQKRQQKVPAALYNRDLNSISLLYQFIDLSTDKILPAGSVNQAISGP